ncbi:heterokaryon incompatibility protein-domain-containing protein [Immersiella caudata]|uniref:Heterokaryon incompatibility protein-domain-containing protein n=1 Tax=Immersiella caudata TaxID=314043 RepID=A0AA40BZE9_9PEZI|nr:heterokaryon incompatibility protein-domain-containing protein [Immersiella caudata]
MATCIDIFSHGAERRLCFAKAFTVQVQIIYRRQIRILRILPGESGDPVHCELYMKYLDDKNSWYDALSYIWGDPTIHQPITIDGHTCDVTTNLAAALRSLRRLDKCPNLRSDALCINQSNSAEKSHQVGLMNDIHSNAKRGILWLGRYHDADSEATDDPNADLTEDEAKTAFGVLKDLSAGLHHEAKTDEMVMACLALGTLLQLPWWQRIWTVQEAVLPNASLFALLLNAFRGRLASDLRDEIYALSGLAGAVSADYSLEVNDVFTGAVCSSINNTGSLASLLRPTWTPDFCAKLDPERQHAWDLHWLSLFRCFNAAPGTMAVLSKGLLVDQICNVYSSRTPDAHDIRAIAAQWQHTTDLVAKANDGIYPRGGTYEDAFWRLMTVDTIDRDDTNSMQETRTGTRNVNSCDRQLFAACSKLIGLANPELRIGDVIYVLLGGRVPFVLRPTPEKLDEKILHEYVSQAYVHGIMDGEVMKEGREPGPVYLI